MDQEHSATSGNADFALGVESSSNLMRIGSQASVSPEASLFEINRKGNEIASSDDEVAQGFHVQNESLEGESEEIIEDQDEDDSDDSHGEAVSELFKNRKPRPRSSDPEVRSFAVSVTHPWHIIDYHLYLLQIEGQKDQVARVNCTLLRDGVECRPLWYDEFFEDDTFDPDLVGQEPSVLFAALPVADRGAQFNGSTYVLEYNWNLRIFRARHFVWVPEDLRNIECAWKESVVIYCVPLLEIIDVMKYSLAQRYRRIEFLSINPRCTTSYVSGDDPGMELVISYQFCQFAVDFAEVILFDVQDAEIEFFVSELLSIMEEIRLTLQRASYRAWFAVREGLSMETFSHKVSFDRYLNDLFTYNKSIEEGSLRGKKWHAPSVETCKEIRDIDAKKRRAKNEQQLNDVFASPGPQVSQEDMIASMLVKTDKGQVDAFLNAQYSCPPISSPVLDELEFEEIDLEDPGSPTVKPAAIEDDGYEITENHHFPLRRLLSRTYRLIQDQPELDTLENRSRFGNLLADLGVCARDPPLDEFETVQEQGFDNETQSLQANDFSDSAEEAPASVRRLFPSPILD